MVEQRKSNLENGLWKYDFATDKYILSPNIGKIFNLEPQDLKSHDALLKRIHSDDIDDYTASYREKTATHQPFTLCYRIVLDGGAIKNIEENVNFILDDEGKVASSYGILSDISAFVKSQDEYFLLSSMLKTLPNLIFVKNIDKGYQFTLVNDNFASFYGFTSAEIVGKYDKDISTPEQARACYVTDNVASKRDITSPLMSVEEIPITKKYIKYMQTIKYAHAINGTNYLICSAMDITDLVRAKQKAEESDKLKSAFLHTISHEIRTPMNSIMGYSQLIGGSGNESETASFCQKIKDYSEQLLHLVTDIVYLANLETASKHLVYEDIDMEMLFADIKSQYEKEVGDKHLTFVCTPHGDPHPVYSNKDAIMQLVKCFLENAIKFTDKGSVAMGYDVEGDHLRIWVEDTGIGIAKKDQRNVFRRFVKLDDFTPGTGIGLYISQKIAKSMNGHIGLQSEVGKGTLVWAELPLDSVEKETL